MKETLVKVQRTTMKNGKPITQHFWVKPDHVKKGDHIVTPPTTDYHINQLDYEDE